MAVSHGGLRRLVYALAALGLVPWLIGVAGSFASWPWIGGLCLLWVIAARRVAGGLLDPQRSARVVRYLDAPSSALWASGVFAAVLLAPLALWRGLQGALPGVQEVRSIVLVASAGAIWAVWGRRRWVRVRETAVPIAGLPAAFDGYRIAHLSDIHLGSVDTAPTVERWVRRTNALGCDLVAVTGDLVSSGTRFYAVAARVLAQLAAPDGVFVVNGNHDLWDPDHWRRELERRGLTVLMHEVRAVVRGGSALFVVGLDCTRSAEETRRFLHDTSASRPQVMLSHYPTFFDGGHDNRPALTLSGHTHGGQIALPWLDRWVNLTSVVGGHRSGLTREGPHYLYVSRGLGTTGVPLRLGAAPEICVIRLCAMPLAEGLPERRPR